MSQDMFVDEDLGSSPVESSGVSGGLSSSNSDLSQQTSQPSDQLPQPFLETEEEILLPDGPPYHCPFPRCKKEYKTKRWFVNHQAAHKINDANKEKPNSQMFQTVVNDIMTQIISEMKREPCYDTVDSRMKKTFLEQLNLKTGSVEWTQFVSELSGPLLDIISKKSKMLPLNQYEEAQRKLNIHLRNKENFERLINVFSSVCTAELSPSLAGRLVFRIATKLMDGIQTFVTRELRASKAAKTPQSPQPELVQEMSVEEERSLSEMLGNLIRESVRRDKRCSSRQRQAQSLCLKDNFTVSQNPVSFEQLLNKENWFSGDENSIVPSENASNFFHIVEKAVRSESSVHKLNTSDKVLDIILQNIEALDLWFHLTNSRLSEECSLFFMREIVGSFVKKSILLEDARKNRLEDKSRQETQAALRTHLLRNYKPTDSEDIDSPSAP